MSRTSVLPLDADARASRSARAFVRRELTEQHAYDELDDVLVVVSELVTNAVVHAGTELVLELRTDLEDDPDAVEVRVSDSDPRTPGRRTLLGGVASQGRGIPLLAALSRRWGVDSRGDGKTVWAVVPLLPSAPASRPLAPGR
jgi:anti-sigma regulatory factor (Ser/Thr protein kinase)